MAAQLGHNTNNGDTATDNDMKIGLLVDSPSMPAPAAANVRRETFSVAQGSLSNIPEHVIAHHSSTNTSATVTRSSTAAPSPPSSSSSSSCTPYLLFVFLSMHCFVEGIVIGLAETVRGTITLVVAVALHKWVEAALVGVQLIKSRVSSLLRYTEIFVYLIIKQ